MAPYFQTPHCVRDELGHLAPSNEVRLSCAAKGCLSQMQFYYEGRRQLQPRVRRRHLELPSDLLAAEGQPPTDSAPQKRCGNEDHGVAVLATHYTLERKEKSKAGA